MHESSNISWEAIKVFEVVARMGSLSQASRELDYSQPTLSRHLAKLEEQLGLSLFERNGRGMLLTSSAMSILKEIKDIKTTANRLSVKARSLTGELNNRVRILMDDDLTLPLISKVLELYKGDRAGVRLYVGKDAKRIQSFNEEVLLSFSKPNLQGLVSFHLGALSYNYYYNPEKYLYDPSEKKTKKGQLSLTTNSSNVDWQLIKNGAKSGLAPDILASNEPCVKRVNHRDPSHYRDVWLTTHEELITSIEIQSMIDELKRLLTTKN